MMGLGSLLIHAHPFLIIGGLAGLATMRPVSPSSGPRDPEPGDWSSGAVPVRQEMTPWLASWLVIAVAMTAVGGRAFPHYLQLFSPPLCALGLLALQGFWGGRSRVLVFAALVATGGIMVADTGVSVAWQLSRYVGRYTF